MLFFQLVLVLGYAYAHWLSKLAPRKQAVAHISLPPYAKMFSHSFSGDFALGSLFTQFHHLLSNRHVSYAPSLFPY